MRKLILILFIFITSAQFTFAQSNPCPSSSDGLNYEMVSYSNTSRDATTPFFNVSFLGKPCFQINYQSFKNAWQFFFDLIVGISIATAVILFMYNAFRGIVSGGNTAEITNARVGMQNAITGLVIVLSTWLIINTINPDLLRLPIFQGLDQISTNSQQGATQNPGTRIDPLPNNN